MRHRTRCPTRCSRFSCNWQPPTRGGRGDAERVRAVRNSRSSQLATRFNLPSH
jgi:hypothetical protein